MKKNLILALIAGITLVAVYSFISAKKNHVPKIKPLAQTGCGTVITSVTVTPLYTGTLSVTWSYTGPTPAYFNVGGDYFCPSGQPWAGSNPQGNSTTISITGSCHGPDEGINGRVTPYCANGMAGTPKVFSYSFSY